MLSVNTFFEKISYKELVTSLGNVMATEFEDFAADQTRFNKTVSLLKNELEESTSPSVSEMIDAVHQKTGSIVLFSFFLGLKANLDHFMNPVSRTFLDVDAETYLQETVARQLPDYQYAQHVLREFYGALTPAHQNRYEGITAYICHLETIGPKLAHYYGYMLGNQLFPRIIPGYGVDVHLTAQYRYMLETYLGKTHK